MSAIVYDRFHLTKNLPSSLDRGLSPSCKRDAALQQVASSLFNNFNNFCLKFFGKCPILYTRDISFHKFSLNQSVTRLKDDRCVFYTKKLIILVLINNSYWIYNFFRRDCRMNAMKKYDASFSVWNQIIQKWTWISDNLLNIGKYSTIE